MPYEKEYTYAQLANRSYENNPSMLPTDWEIATQKVGKDGSFAATAYKNEKTRQVVIAYRGTDDWRLPYQNGGDNSADLAIVGGNDNWDRQFTEGLEFAKQVIDKYPGYAVTTTGHSLGGALAQSSAQMFGLDGIAFDPGGAKNIVQSKAFQQWAQEHGLPSQGKGMPASFNNYLVNSSAVSHRSGAQVGRTTPLSGVAGRDAWERMATEFGKAIPNALGRVVAEGNDQAQRHSMDRIEKMFKEAVQQGHLYQIGAAEKPAHAPTYTQNSPALSPDKQAFLEQARSAVNALHDRQPLPFDGQQRDNITVALAHAGWSKGMNAVEHALLNTADNSKISLLNQVGPFDFQYATIDVQTAAKQPPERSLTLLAEAPEHQQIQHDLEQQRQVERTMQPSGIRMGMV